MPLARIVYARGRNPGSWLIRQWPDSAPARWSHAGIVVVGADGLDEVWHATWPTGFHRLSWREFVDRYPAHQVVEYTVAASPLEQWSWCAHRQGLRYATGTVLGRMLGLRSSEQRADMCSEVAENFLAAMGCVPRWRGAMHLVTPNASFHNLAGVIR